MASAPNAATFNRLPASPSPGNRKRKHPLPSPSTSRSQEGRRASLYARRSEENTAQHIPSSARSFSPHYPRSSRSFDREDDQVQSAEVTDGRESRRKRRRIALEQRVTDETQSPEGARSRSISPSVEDQQLEEADGIGPVEFWTRTGHWPTNLATMSQDRSVSPQKRSRTSSYNQSVAQGDAPSPYSTAFEKYIAERGLYMRELQGRALVNDDSKGFCQQLLNGSYKTPQHSSYPLSQFLLVWDQVRSRNEAKIFRDLTPLLVPSPELLYVGGNKELEHVRDELSVEWNKSKPMAGPKPKPDCAVGIARDAFTEEELAKLRNHASFERPTFFTDNILFPFLLCEAKCGNEGLDRADRQNMHSASMAVDAILHLYRALGDGREHELSGQVLVFSISHNHDAVKLYGHFAIVQESRTSFYRYHVTTFNLGLGDDDWKKPYNVTMGIYQAFYSQHLRRVQNALKDMGRPAVASVEDSIDDVEASSQDIHDTASSSQDTTFKLPHAPASKRQKGELALLREQLARQEQQHKEQMAKQEQQHKEEMVKHEAQMAKQEQQHKEEMVKHEAQMAKQEQQHKEEMVKHEAQMAKQEQQHKEQMNLLNRLVERQG